MFIKNAIVGAKQLWLANGMISFDGVSEVNINNVKIQFNKDIKKSPKEIGLFLKN